MARLFILCHIFSDYTFSQRRCHLLDISQSLIFLSAVFTMTIIPTTTALLCLFFCPQSFSFALNIIFSFLSSITVPYALASSNLKKLCSPPPGYSTLSIAQPCNPIQNWARRTWPSSQIVFVSTALTDGVNSATHISAFCFHSPLASLDLTSEMKATHLTGVLRGKQLPELEQISFLSAGDNMQEIFQRNSVNFLLCLKSYLKKANRFTSGHDLSSEQTRYFFPTTNTQHGNCKNKHTHELNIPSCLPQRRETQGTHPEGLA